MRITPLASGSGGNCLLLEAGSTRVLVDLGLPAQEAERRLAQAGVPPRSLDGVLLTHRHRDHVAGVSVFCRRHGVPVHATRATARSLGSEMVRLLRPMRLGEAFPLGEVSVHPFALCHDAPETAGFVVDAGGFRYGHATDLGCADGDVLRVPRDCDALLLEFNHDLRMLEEGPYPFPLKRRVAASTGHLSNEQAAVLLRRLAGPRLRHVWLAHLSATNNREELALAAARGALEGRNGVSVVVARQDRPGRTLDLRAFS